jgi:pimeloyl-ACP methyl ester carboxylesterase
VPRQRLFLLVIAILSIVLSWWQIAAARTGLVVQSLSRDGIPILYVAPARSQKIPGVLIAHGFAASKQLMLGYAYTLAHAGYGVMLWDFGGHGANHQPLARLSLQNDLNIAYKALLAQPEVDPQRLAVLGHSMGSGVAMTAAILDRDRFAATVAISPIQAAVTPQVPVNLQLQAGSWEPRFVANAEQLLQQAGGESQGRSLVIIPNAEHVTILFRHASHQVAKTWLDRSFGIQNSSNYRDRRMTWYGVHLFAWLLVLGAVAPVISNRILPRSPRIWQRFPARGVSELLFQAAIQTHNSATLGKSDRLKSWIGLILSPLGALGVLALLNRLTEIESLGGVLVGGALGIWFYAAGIVWLLVNSRLSRLTLPGLGLGLGLFLLLWIAFGVMAQAVWLQWWLVPVRLQLWLWLSLLCLPWFLASGIAQQQGRIKSRFLWWLGQSLVLVIGLLATIQFFPQLGFIFLLLPVFPLFLAMFAIASASIQDIWAYAIGCSLFFSWAIAAAFPLVR